MRLEKRDLSSSSEEWQSSSSSRNHNKKATTGGGPKPAKIAICPNICSLTILPDKKSAGKGQKKEIQKMSDRVKSIQKGLQKNKE